MVNENIAHLKFGTEIGKDSEIFTNILQETESFLLKGIAIGLFMTLVGILA